MNRSPKVCLLLLIAWGLMASHRSHATPITDTASYTPNVLIPDGTALGVADTRIFSTLINSITEVRVMLTIAGSPNSGDAFNGDFYVTLSHGPGFAVLLNRVGRTAANDFGYSDSGFNVTFDDSPTGVDIHNYQLTTMPGGGALTGTWGSDGRDVNPASALDSSPRTAFLSSFDGLDAAGEWTLFVADTSPLGTGRLVSWQLEVTGEVPDRGSTWILLAFGIAGILGGEMFQRASRLDQPARLLV